MEPPVTGRRTEVFVSTVLPTFLDVTVSLQKVSFTQVRRYTLADRLNGIPELVVEVFSLDAAIDMAELLGQIAVVMLDEPAVPRFDGIVRKVEQRTLDIAGVSCYALTVVPRLWLTTERSGHRIFQQRTALEIVSDVLQPYGPAMDRPQGAILQRALGALEYRVQCGESDEAFLFRILSEDGLVSLFTPDDTGRRQWIVTDDTSAGSADMEVPFRPASGALAATGPHVSVATVFARLCPSEVKLRDYDHEKPAFLLERRHVSADGVAMEDSLTKYSYAVGRFDDDQGGDVLAGIRLEEARSRSRTYRWEASFAMRPGMKIRLHDHPRDEANGDFLVVSAWTEVELSTRKHMAEVVPAAFPWRPDVRSKPRIQGTQTAFVVGAPGKEIDVDQEGRVLVQFRWDTRKAGASRRVRVAMPWAGPGRGFWTLPRVGDEVVIGYLDGDPDEPLVVGSVNNARAPTAMPLPEFEARSAWVSRSTPGGNGYSYIIMDDVAGKELLAIRSQKDFECDVQRNSLSKIGGSSAVCVAKGQSMDVGGDVHTNVKGKVELHAGEVEVSSKGDINFNANGARNDSAETFHYLSSPFIYLVGRDTIDAQAQSKIVLKVGGSSITIEEGKITLVSPLVEINP